MKEVKKYISYWRSALPTSYKYCVDFSKNSENILTVSPPSLKHFMEIDQIANKEQKYISRFSRKVLAGWGQVCIDKIEVW